MAEQTNKELIIIDTSEPFKNKLLEDILSINQGHVPLVGSLENAKDLENLLKMSVKDKKLATKEILDLVKKNSSVKFQGQWRILVKMKSHLTLLAPWLWKG